MGYIERGLGLRWDESRFSPDKLFMGGGVTFFSFAMCLFDTRPVAGCYGK